MQLFFLYELVSLSSLVLHKGKVEEKIMDEYEGYVAYFKAEDAKVNHSTVKAQRKQEELHERDLLA